VDSVDRRLRGPAPRRIPASSVIVLWGFGVLAQGLAMVTGSFGYLSDPRAALSATSSLPAALALLAQAGLLATLLAGWRHAGRRTAGTLVVVLMVVASQVVLGLFAGLKEAVIIQFFAVFFGYGVRRRVRFIPVLLVGVTSVVFVLPFVTQYRVHVLTQSGRLTPTQVVATVGLDDLLSSADRVPVSQSVVQFSQRLSRVGDVAVILQRTPSIVPYKPALELAAAPVLGVVPRSVWQGKPVLDAGYEMSHTYYGLPLGVYSASAMTPYGDLWRHGGWLPVCAGMAVLGAGTRTVDRRTGNPREDPRVLFLPMLLFAPLVKQETDYLGFWASLAGVVLLAAVTARMVTALGKGPEARRPGA
jgi:hypothetical protein